MSVGGTIGCGGANASTVEVFCEAECDRVAHCAGPFPGTVCLQNCTSRDDIRRYRREAIDTVAACIRELSCAEFREPDAYIPCWERAEADIDPTPETRAFCADFSEVRFECGGSYSTSACEYDYSILTDEFLSELAECNASPSCKGVEACSDAVWEAW